ncbi:MAG: nucleotide sugar dehydrogenase [Gemmataceae bacterium]|nr:nucleotide sugar dehydrogenase [Gemmataceae bacterium]
MPTTEAGCGYVAASGRACRLRLYFTREIAVQWLDDLAAKLADKSCRVGVLGLGYVGLPLARTFAAAGFRVLGFDVDPVKVAKLQSGASYIGHVGVEAIDEMRRKGFEATCNFDRLAEADAILICVPTPLSLSREPDLGHVENSVRAIADRLRPGQLIVLESTTYPGTTRDIVRPIMESGPLRVGREVFLAYSPEREDPGNSEHATASLPKVVGALDADSLKLATALYRQVVVQVVPVSSAQAAEACKMLENTYRALNIALVNELKMLFDRMGIDIWEVIEAAKTKPFGFQAFYPGPGLGGHCIPIDPFYLAWIGKQHGVPCRLIELAGAINTAMPVYVVHKVAEALERRQKQIQGSRIALLGMAYKRNVDDPRESPGFELMRLLRTEGAEVTYNDPHIPRLPPMQRYPDLAMESQELTRSYLAGQDCVLIVTDHDLYDWNWIVENAALVVDTRNATRDVVQCRERIVLS